MELGHFIYNTRKTGPTGKNFGFVLIEKFKKRISNEKFNPQKATIREPFPKIKALSSNFQESGGETSPSPPSSYVSVAIRKYRIPFFDSIYNGETEN